MRNEHGKVVALSGMVGLIGLLGFLPAARGGSEPIAVFYANSNGSYLETEKPTRYHALNVLDGNPATAWCSLRTGKGSRLEIVFAERISIDRVDVFTGNQLDPKSWKSFSRVRDLDFLVGDTLHPQTLEDRQAGQTLRFEPALTTDRLIVRLKAAHRGDGERHTCLSDLVFYRGKTPVATKNLPALLKQKRKALPFIDTWVAGPEALRDRELVFGIAGGYRFTFTPSEPTKQTQRKIGPWQLEQLAPVLKDGAEDVRIFVSRDDAGRVESLKIEEGPMAGLYQRRGF